MRERESRGVRKFRFMEILAVSYSIDLRTVVGREQGPIEDKVVPSQLSMSLYTRLCACNHLIAFTTACGRYPYSFLLCSFVERMYATLLSAD